MRYVIEARRGGSLVASFVTAPMSESAIDARVAGIVARDEYPGCEVTAHEHEDYRGEDDDREVADDMDRSYGPARLHDDGYYARNDAGEYAWM